MQGGHEKKLSPLVCAIERVLVTVRHADHHLNNYQHRQVRKRERETWQDGKLLSKHGKKRRYWAAKKEHHQ